MSRYLFLFSILTIYIFVEIYGYQAIKSFSNSGKGKIIGSLLYFGATFIFIILLYWASQIKASGSVSSISKFGSALLMGIFLGKILLVVLICIEDLTRLIRWGINQNSSTDTKINRSQFLNAIFLVVSSLPIAAFLYGTIKTAYDYQIKKINIKIKNLSDEWKGLKIVQISDIHSGSFSDKNAVIKGIQMINELDADIFVFTGDLVNSRAIEFEPWKEVFSKITAKMGKYAILGNHDYGDYVEWESLNDKRSNLVHLKNMIEDCGWKLLLNSSEILERNGEKLVLAGVENWGAKMRFRRYGDLKKTISNIPNHLNIILLSHDPSHWEAEVLNYPQIQLTLSGHTHGMQFGVETKWFRFSPVQWVYKQWAGLYEKAGQKLYVNRGFGFIGYQGRVGIRPEITLITLT